MEEQRQCRTCTESKPMTQFHLSPSSKGGRTKDCKDCISANRKSRAVPRVATTQQRKEFWKYQLHPVLGYKFSAKTTGL